MKSPCVNFYPLRVGYCRHLEWCTQRGGSLKPTCFPANCALIRHPQHGWILYDTGYAEHFFRATDRFPERLYRWSVPVTLPPTEHLSAQLARFELTTSDLSWCFISHFHADHVSGLRDVPTASFMALRADVDRLNHVRHRRWSALVQGHLPSLIPENFDDRIHLAEDAKRIGLPTWIAPFLCGYDLFGDSSLIAVELPGHSSGQMGILIPNADGRPIFLVADSCWSLRACKEGRLPHWPGMMINANSRQFVETFYALQQLICREPSVVVLPSHCSSAWRSVGVE